MTRGDSFGFTHIVIENDGPRTLLLLHGTGGDEMDLVDLGSFIDPKAQILSPRGNVREGDMARFFRRLGPGVFDEQDIKARSAELARFVGEATEAYGFNRSPVWAVGFSNGANIAASLLLLEPETLAGAILLRPMLPIEPESMPDLSGRRIYIAAGTLDEMIPQESTKALVSRLEDAGAQVTIRWAEAGHRFGREELEAAREWYLSNA
ncbi:MAG: alpha/beta hydrolase [Alkalispirochaetaceae bacterium]